MSEKIYFKNSPLLRKKYKNHANYYKSGGAFDEEKGRYQYDPDYYEFDKYQLEIDPTETMEEVENYTPDQQKQEIIKCANSFQYFCQKYVKILHPMQGLIPFVMYKYQDKVIYNYENYRFNIISKFRQGGLTTVSLLWGTWRCLFQTDQQIMLISKSDKDATDIGMMVDRCCDNLPSWLQPKKKEGKWNDHIKQFTDTGSSIKFHSPVAARGKAVTFLIIDEAAFIADMESHWKAMWPVLSTGGSCVVVSTVNGLGNWYEQTYHEAKENINKFNVIDLDYWEHPDYNNPEWVEDQKAQLGERGFLQEVLRQFQGSGSTYFPTNIIVSLTEETRNNYPIKKMFPKWINEKGRVSQIENEHHEKGALWLWKEPIDGHEYIMGVDCADGQGENNDSSCFQIIDVGTLEQVAEFYSNIIIPNDFAQLVQQVAIYYNNSLVVVENMAAGSAVLNTLQFALYYDNLYYENKKSSALKPGIKIGSQNRNEYLESLQNKLYNQTLKINSIRFVTEVQTFEFNRTTQKAEAQKGKHDDAIMAMCFALYVRDSMARDIPVGATTPKEVPAYVKNQVYEEIKRELMNSKLEDLLEENNDIQDLLFDVSEMSDMAFKFRRKNDKLLKEFGW